MKKQSFFIFLSFIAAILHAENKADYVFNVIYEHTERKISGYEDIVYHNNSPDSLSEMKFHMYANLFKKGSNFFTKKHSDADYGYIEADSIFIEGERSADMEINGTMGTLRLNSPVMPGQTVKIRIYFTNKIPYPFLREGWSSEQSDISQWYPKAAVYKNGKWADFQYTKKNEFYNEYGDYTLNISLPEDMYIFGTGKITAPESEIAAIDSIAADTMKVNTKKKLITEKKKELFIKSKQITIKAENVHDMAFVVTKNPAVIKETKNGITVIISCRKESRKLYEKEKDAVFNSLEYYGSQYMSYPYEYLTISEGMLKAGGGMEYPTFVIITGIQNDGIDDFKFIESHILETIISHEIGHQWFYLISGNNETAEPFMDEGLNTFAEVSYMESRYGEKNNYYSIKPFFDISLFDYHYYMTEYLQNTKQSFPLNSDALSYEGNEGISIFYSKGYLVVRQIEDMVGKNAFRSIMREYFEKIAFTHTSIEGFLNFFDEKTEGKYYTQFKSMLYENYSNDFYFQKIHREKYNNYAVLGNEKYFDINVPVFIEMKDGETLTVRRRMGNDTIYIPDGEIKQMIIDPEMKYLDFDYHNNSMKNGTKIHIFPEMPDHFKNNLYIYPWADYSLFDKLSLGVKTEFCDNPDIELGSIAFNGKWSNRLFAGYDLTDKYPIVKGLFKSFDGKDKVTVGFVEYEFAKSRILLRPGIVGYQNSKDGTRFSVELSMPVRVSLNDERFEQYYMDGTLSMLKFSGKYEGKRGIFNWNYKGDICLSDKLIYSDYDFLRFENNFSVYANLSGMPMGISYRGGYLYGSSYPENMFSLYRGKLLLFDDINSVLSGYTFQAAFADNGYGYLTKEDDSYSALNRFRVFAGNEVRVYFDLYSLGKGIATAERVVQAGLQFNAGRFFSLNIPIYNTEYGLILKNRIAFTISSEIIK